MHNLVSIIMPAYNAEKYISASIRSVLNQTHENWELIVIDDGSTDKTAEVVKSFLATESRIKYFFQINGGQGKARNTGIKNSTGDLIAFLDSDDLWESEKLSLQLERMEETRADVVFSDAYIFSEDRTGETTTFSAISPEFIYGHHEGSDMFRLLFISNRIPILTVLVGKGILQKVGLFDEQREYQNCEDYELWLRLARLGAVFFGMKEKLASYRYHSSSMMRNDSRLLKPMVAVARKHCRAGGIDPREVKRVIRGLYRNLISTLIEENRIADALDYIREFSDWDRYGPVTWMQRALIKIAPKKYNFISKECLYRIEWHTAKLRDKLEQIHSTTNLW
jgi:glycosyltransferase involved in cell wall biosynthesis